MSRRGRDAKARDRRHRESVAQRSESSARTGLALAPVAPATDVETEPVAPAQSAAETPERPAAVVVGRPPRARTQKARRRQVGRVTELEHLQSLAIAAKLLPQPSMPRSGGSDVTAQTGQRSPTPWA